MKTPKSIGRVIGALLLVQLVGLTVAFNLQMPGGGKDYLDQAAGMETAIRTAVILLLVSSAITLGIAVVAFPVFRQYSVRTAVWLVAISTVWIVMQSVDNAHILSMLSLSQRYIEAAGANADLYNMLGAQVRSTRVFVHYGVLLTTDVWFGLFYGALFAFRLVPRLLGGLGLLAVVLHTVGISLSAFIGYPIMWPLAYGFGISYLLFGGWLVVKGFPENAERGMRNAEGKSQNRER